MVAVEEMSRLIVLSLLLLAIDTASASLHNAGRSGTPHSKIDGTPDRMPSVFSPEEAQYDRYAACLATIQGLRHMHGKPVGQDEDPRGPFDGFEGKHGAEEANNHKHAHNDLHSSDLVKALGMPVSLFNQLTQQVKRDKALKDKVSKQAFLYRMAATLNMDRVPLFEENQLPEKMLKTTGQQKFEAFCESMSEIEELRTNQIRKLKKTIQASAKNKKSDPATISPKVRAAFEMFPIQAEEIVKKHGMHAVEFNEMREKTKSNPLFRWKVEKYLKNRDTDGTT